MPIYTSNFLDNISGFLFSKNKLDDLNMYAPAYLLSINALYPLYSFDGAILARVMNLCVVAALQFLIYKVSLVIRKQNCTRVDFKASFTLFFTSPFTILNILLIEGIDLYITVLLIAGIYLLLQNHAFLAGLIFGFIAMMQFTYVLYFIGLVWYTNRKNGNGLMARFLIGGIAMITSIVLPFSIVSKNYVINSLLISNHDYVFNAQFSSLYAFNYSLIFHSNFLGIFSKWTNDFSFDLPSNLISLSIFFILARYLCADFSPSKSLVELFIPCFFLTINLSTFSYIVILSLICISVADAKKEIKGLYTNLNILSFLQLLLMYFQTLSGNQPFIPLLGGDLIVYCFVFAKLVIIDVSLIKIIKITRNTPAQRNITPFILLHSEQHQE